MHKIRALCLLIRTETLQNATAGRGRRRLQQEGGVNGYGARACWKKKHPVIGYIEVARTY